ncbi:hypothetical protein BH10PSE12_BH10PSE12_28570 [soil metagenome]
MVLEQALLQVRPGQDDAFRDAIIRARPLIAASPGFVSMDVHPAMEEPGTYLLLVFWESIADHRDGFRRSDRYEQWRELLHGFYDPMPQVRYFGEPL